MKRYEYITFQASGEDPNPMLNALGKNGWRMVHVNVIESAIIYVFERELLEQVT